MEPKDFFLTEADESVLQPENIKLPLKPHQLVSLHRMIILDKDCEFNCNNMNFIIK